MINRRSFLLGATAAWAADDPPPAIGWATHPPDGQIQFPNAGKRVKPNAKDVRPRPTISCLDTPARRQLFKDLEKGYDELLRRAPGPYPPTLPVNPTSLLHHMWLHAYYCGQVGIHSNWFFLPWHRAFLYFHERILQSIVGDHFRLPVWEWDRCNELPPFYRDWASGHLHAPYDPSDDLAHKVTTGYLQSWLQSDSPSDFLGNAASKPHATPNAVSGPHDLVHTTFGTLMEVPRTAALDPLFYTHHANIDRFWEFWRGAYGFSDDKDWLRQSFSFYDRDGEPVSIAVSDLLNLDALGYYYPSPPDANLIYPCKTVTQSGFNADTMTVRFAAADFQEILTAGIRAVSRAVVDTLAQGSANAQTLTLPCRIFGMPHKAKNGLRYLVGMRNSGDGAAVPTSQIIGGFSVFMSDDMGPMDVVATCCLDIHDIEFLAANNFQVAFVWGEPDPSGTAIPAGADQPFWPITRVELLFRIPGAVSPR